MEHMLTAHLAVHHHFATSTLESSRALSRRLCGLSNRTYRERLQRRWTESWTAAVARPVFFNCNDYFPIVMTLLNCNDSTAGLQIRLSMLPAGWPSRQSRSVLDRSMRSSVIELVLVLPYGRKYAGFPWQDFSPTLPWHFVKSPTFYWQLSNSRTFSGFPDKWSPCL